MNKGTLDSTRHLDESVDRKSHREAKRKWEVENRSLQTINKYRHINEKDERHPFGVGHIIC